MAHRVIAVLKSLERLEFGGECGRALGGLRHYVAREGISLRIQTLTVRRAEDGRGLALGLKCLSDTAGLNVTLICAPDSGGQE